MKSNLVKTLFVVCMMSMFGGCAKKESESNNIANPWQEVTSVQEAKDICGFTIDVPDNIDSGAIESIQVTDNIIEVNYDNDISIRKGNTNEDISGDYNDYSNVIEQTINNINVTLKGNDNNYNSVVYYVNQYCYSIYSVNGISIDLIAYVVNNIE